MYIQAKPLLDLVRSCSYPVENYTGHCRRRRWRRQERRDPIKIACLLLMFPDSFISTPARWEHQVRHATMNLLT